MLAMSIMALISTAGIAFYVRFLVASWRERKSPHGVSTVTVCDSIGMKPKQSIPRPNPFQRGYGLEATTNQELRKDLDVNPRSCS